MKKKIPILVPAAVVLAALAFCLGWQFGRRGGVPDSVRAALPRHTIAYPEDYPTTADDAGADAFGGSLDHADSGYYEAGDFHAMQSGGGLHILSGYETYQQTEDYTCGAASALMVLHWFGDDSWDEMTIAGRMEASPDTGVSVENLAGFFGSLGWQVEVHADTDMRFEMPEDFEAFLVERLDAGVPVMVDWVDWGGHWQTVIGVDDCGTESVFDDVLILADSYDFTDHSQDGYYTYPLGRFFYMWQEGPVVQKAEPYVQPFVCARPAA